MRASLLRRVWLGGAASTPMLGLDVRPASGSSINVLQPPSSARSVAQSQPLAFLQPEHRQLLAHMRVGKPQTFMRKFNISLSPVIYDELLKLPLRFALHSFERLTQHYQNCNYVMAEDGGMPPGVYRFPPRESEMGSRKKKSWGCGGTRPYMAPELLQSREAGLCCANDIWALGCVLYALATGRVEPHAVALLSNEALRGGEFAGHTLSSILDTKLSLSFASFVVALLTVDPQHRPSASTILSYFTLSGEGDEREVSFHMSSAFFKDLDDL